MASMITDLGRYIHLHFIETKVISGSSLSYRWWAMKRLLFLALRGRSKCASYLYPKELVVENALGTFLLPPMSDSILTMNASKAEYNLQQYFSIPDGQVFLDIGANGGQYTVMIAKMCSKNLIYSFEPTPSTYHVLTRNVQLNNVGKQVITANVALGESAGRAKFAQHSSFSGLNRIVADTDAAPTDFQVLDVEVKPLDAFMEANKIGAERIALIKIDVEGHELSVLKGASRTLASLPEDCRFLVEIHPHSTTKDEVFRLMTSHGFCSEELDEENFMFSKTPNHIS